MTVPWLLMEALARAFVLMLQSAIGSIATGISHVGSFLLHSIHRCFPSSDNDGPRLTFRTSGRLWADEVTMECRSSLVQGHLTASKVQLSGLHTVSLTALSMDLSDEKCLVLQSSLSVDSLSVDCDYRVSGELATLRLVDYRGHVNILWKRMTVDVRLVGALQRAGQQDFIHLHTFKLNPTIPFIQFEFSDIGAPRNEQDVFRVTLNNILWQRLYDVLFLYVEREIGKLVIQFLHQFTLRVPFNEIFVFPR